MTAKVKIRVPGPWRPHATVEPTSADAPVIANCCRRVVHGRDLQIRTMGKGMFQRECFDCKKSTIYVWKETEAEKS